jgi:hypothetical protein
MNSYSFIDILTGEVEFEEKKYKFDGINIPMIQRDYAQGRVGEEEIRKRFLRSIFEALESREALELDFIYGSPKTLDNKLYFMPLDGQQRLTTLFLLYWYIGNRELIGDALVTLRTSLKKFTYATRATSELFCAKLTEISLGFTSLPSEEIKNAAWHHSSFLNDPTVQSMLVMLDAIHKRYGVQKRNLFQGLSQITFYCLPLDGFDLTDDLYIKMNARGKQLTYFENFKADLIKWMKGKNNPFKKFFQKQKDYNGRNVEYHQYFELKLDNQWTQLFWQISKKNISPEMKLVDPYILRFWNRYLLNSYIIISDLIQDAFENDSIFKELYGDQGEDSEFVYNNFETYQTLLEKKNIIEFLEKIFEGLSLHYDEVNQIIQPTWDNNNNWNLFSIEINQRQRILLFAVTKYFERNTFDPVLFKNWIRVVWNIIIDPGIRSVPRMVGAMRFINQMSKYSKDIYSFLQNPNSVLFTSNLPFKNQFEEEHWKAILIRKGSAWEQSIIEAESHPLFQGNIRFMLEFDEPRDLKPFMDITKFKNRKDASFELFKNNSLHDNPSDYLWVRALLAKSPDIELPLKLSNGRFNDWRSLINGSFIKGMRILIDDIANRMNDVEERLWEICNEYQIDHSQLWVYQLVKWTGKGGETLLGNYSETRRIQKYDYYGNAPMHIYLYNQTRWTEGNIILSNYRNEIIAALLKSYNDVRHNDEWKNIQNSFFRGWNVQLERIVGNFSYTYDFDKDFVKVGIKSTPELEQQLKNIQLTSEERENGWICRLIFDYSYIQIDEIESFLKNIEDNVFTKSNQDSLINKIENTK